MLPTNTLGIVGDIVLGCSILHTLLPPWESFDGFPRFQPYYKVFIYIIGYIALNARSTVHTSISTKNTKGVNGKQHEDGK